MNSTITKSEIINYLFKSNIFKFKETLNDEECPYIFDISKSLNNIESMNILISYIQSILNSNNVCFEDINLIVGIENQCFPISFQLSNNNKLSMIMALSDITTTTSKSTNFTMSISGSKVSIGDEGIIIMDVLISKEKTLEILKYLEGKGIIISIILVILDNENGVVDEIRTCGYKVITLLNMFSIIEILVFNKSIETFQYEKIGNYINILKNEYIKRLSNDDKNDTINNTSNDTFPTLFNHKLRSVILSLIAEKKTAICLSLDVSTWAEAVNIINLCGSRICMIKTNISMYSDITSYSEFSKSVLELAKIHKFLILEDTQISPLKPTNTFKSIQLISKWANFITIPCYENVLLNDTLTFLDYWLPEKETINITSCLILETSNTNQSFSNKITDKTLEKYSHIVPIVITQKALNIKNFLKLTPNIKLEKLVPIGASFRSIENAIIDDENHIVIMGNSIYKNYSNEEIVQNITEYADETWRCFNIAFEHIISKIQSFEDEYTRIQKILIENYEKAESERKILMKKTINENAKKTEKTEDEKGTWNLKRLSGYFKKNKQPKVIRENIII